MTDNVGKDRFWQRVRGMLGRHEALRASGGAEALEALRKRYPAGRPVEEELQRGWLFAAERKVSLCVIALEIDCYVDYLSAYGRDAAEDCMEVLERLIASLLVREEDSCMRLGQSSFILVLPDMPMLMGRELALKIGQAVRREGLINKESHAGAVTLGAGLAVVNPEPPYDRNVLDVAKQALRRAQRRGLGRLDIADIRGGERRDVAA